VSFWTEDKNKSCLQIAAGIKELISKSQQIIHIDYNTCRGLYSILDCGITLIRLKIRFHNLNVFYSEKY